MKPLSALRTYDRKASVRLFAERCSKGQGRCRTIVFLPIRTTPCTSLSPRKLFRIYDMIVIREDLIGSDGTSGVPCAFAAS